MAERKDILNDIRTQYGNALNQSQVARYLHVGKDSARAFLSDLPFYRLDKKHKTYLAIDLAKKIDRCGSR